MALLDLLSRWRSDPSVAANVTAWEIIPKRHPHYVELPASLEPALRSKLADLGIKRLYQHQAEVWNQVTAGSHTAVITGTASGKSLAYNLPVLDHLLKNPDSRALYLFPTKALAYDQLSVLRNLTSLPVSSYDGDTPSGDRPGIRKKARLVATNPDMLHLGILPHHTEWAGFFENLDFVVIDEMHTYRGVFGSHVANVIRRLKRIAANYHSTPVFVATSATIGNPADFAERLIEEPVQLVTTDASARGEKHFLLYNPPVVDHDLGLRAGMVQESEKLVRDLLAYNLQVILFGRTRKSVEFMISRLRETVDLPSDALSAYRSGYLPAHRRAIEAGLRTGTIRLAAATNALELGIDIGGLDAAVLAGYPGSISSTWQQAGRSGRSDHPSLSVLVVSSDPLDQYLANHPVYFLDRSPEHALIDPDNLLILLTHIQCAAFELAFDQGERFGRLSLTMTAQFLDFLTASGRIHQSGGRYYWMQDAYPAGEFSLRTTSPDRVHLYLQETDGRSAVLGTVDRESAFWMVHPGAVYLHQGESYLVESLDLERQTAQLSSAALPYYTEPRRDSAVECLARTANRRAGESDLHVGELKITTQITGYKKISWSDYQVLGQEPLDLPPSELETTGFWISFPDTLIDELKAAGEWNSGQLDYGPNWMEIRRSVLQRDGGVCRVCRQAFPNSSLHVHHLEPLRGFQSYREANRLDNLITVCPPCHRRLERIVRVKSGLTGLAYVFHHLAPLLLMCDRRDLGTHVDAESPLESGRPVVVLHENIPSGLGYSQALFDRHSQLTGLALDLIANCPCPDGCPSCVGPGGEHGQGSKAETSAILDRMV